MAALIEEQSRTSENFSASSQHYGGPAVKPQQQESNLFSLPTWVSRVGEFLLGLVAGFFGMMIHVALAICLLLSPILALVGVVLFSALLIEGTGLVLRAIGAAQ